MEPDFSNPYSELGMKVSGAQAHRCAVAPNPTLDCYITGTLDVKWSTGCTGRAQLESAPALPFYLGAPPLA
jgi:hypothetical protein